MAIEEHIGTSDDWFLGEDKSLNFSIFMADEVTPQPITGWGLSWMLKKQPLDADVAAKITKTTVSGITITDASGGLCTVLVADTDTATLSSGLYFHELKRTDNGSETVLSSGTVALRQAVHR